MVMKLLGCSYNKKGESAFTKVIDMNAEENIAEQPYSQGLGTDSATW